MDRRLLRAEDAFDASERSTDELGAPGASQDSGGCKHQSGSHPAGGRAAGIGQPGPGDRICRRDCSAPGGETGACSFTADAGRRVGRQERSMRLHRRLRGRPLCPREAAVDRGHAAQAPTADPLRRQRGSRRPRSRPRLRGEDGTFAERAHITPSLATRCVIVATGVAALAQGFRRSPYSAARGRRPPRPSRVLAQAAVRTARAALARSTRARPRERQLPVGVWRGSWRILRMAESDLVVRGGGGEGADLLCACLDDHAEF